MDDHLFKMTLLGVLGGTLSLWILSSLIVRVSGTWSRVLSDEDQCAGERPETIKLNAFGPYVSGVGDVVGGKQNYSGLIIGRTLHLRRRDHGVRFLQAQGYPLPIAEKRDGAEAAQHRLRVVGDELVGEFFAFNVQYTHQPPRVTQVLKMKASVRRYTRLASAGADATVVEALDRREQPASIA